MGCIGSRLTTVRNNGLTGSRRNSLRRQNTFHVLNVDDMGRPISPGKLEVTETDLVLHVRGKPSLTWPLRCLRRYGFDNDLFSFESGRRCPTGAGIFAFRCNRAQSLFNILQSRIQGNSATTPNTVPSTPITPTNTCSNNPSTPVSSTFVYVNLAENSSNRQTTNAPDVTQVFPGSQTVPCSLNSMTANSSGGSSAFPLSQSLQQSQLLEDSHPLYMNVEGPAAVTQQSMPSNQQKGSNISRHEGPNGSSSRISSAYYQNANALKSQQHGREANNSNNSSRAGGKTGDYDSILYTNVICSPGNEQMSSSHCYSAFPNNSLAAAAEPMGLSRIEYAELDLKTDIRTSSSSSTKPLFSSSRFSMLHNKENKPSADDSKFRFKFGKTNSVLSGSHTTTAAVGKRGLSGVHSLGMDIPVTPPSNSSPPPNNGELGYATIDFDRTAALGAVTRTKINLDFLSSSHHEDRHENAVRKTRHNSTAL